MKHITLILFALIISGIIITSFFFIGDDDVESYTKDFIEEIIVQNHSQNLSEGDNQKIAQFFQNFDVLNIPQPIIEDVVIRYFDVVTDPVHNERFLQYISVKYEEIDSTTFDTDIYFEYISYSEERTIDEIYFGQIVVRSYDLDFTELEIIEIKPMEKQK